MAKIVKRRIRWTASNSADVVNYKLYWTLQSAGNPTYTDSNVAVAAGKTSVILPDEAPTFPTAAEASYLFGITSVDDVGNESDMAITPAVAIDFLAPNPPTVLVVETV
jgi:hypothetical protein